MDHINFAVTTIFLDLGYSQAPGGLGFFYVEGGLFYGPADPRPTVFMSYMNYPNYKFGSGPEVRLNQYAWYGFNISPHYYSGTSSSSFKLQYAVGESQSGWTTHSTTEILPDRVGTPKAEMERTKHKTTGVNTSNGETYTKDLKYRPTSGWFQWGHLVCDSSTDSEWDVYKFDEQDYYMRNVPPEPGGC